MAHSQATYNNFKATANGQHLPEWSEEVQQQLTEIALNSIMIIRVIAAPRVYLLN